MSIAKRVAESCEKLAQNDPEAAFIPACIALDATAGLEHPSFDNARRMKQFIDDHMAPICYGGLRCVAGHSIRLPALLPKMRPGCDGTVSFGEVLYKAVRCQLMHEATFDRYVEFKPNVILGSNSGKYQFCDLLPLGLIAAVVCSPANANLHFTRDCEIVFPSSDIAIADLRTDWPMVPSMSALEFATGIRRVAQEMSERPNGPKY